MSRYPKIELAGAVVVITGGARGIGAATARLFADRGADVWIGDVDDVVAKETANGIPNAHSGALDVTKPESWAGFLDQVRAESGPVDILINNAGVMPLGGFIEENERTTDLILDVNVRGPLNGARAVLPQMVARGRGHVVNVASMAGKLAVPGMVTYNASKFGAVGLSVALRKEYGNTGVSVSCVLPSAVRTELASGAPLGKGMPTVDPEDVAAAVVRSVDTRRAQISVPGWLAFGWGLVDLFVPEPVERLARRLIDDRRALTSLDLNARGAYIERIERQSKEHQK
ncbi:SDR family oxidoreductase [Mycobacteroides abscessus]|uniref:SDR family oxidoreductase n=1 Tax=Mycobacteroides abscessus TaxID=36809 RepID=UPI0009281455|nr:SDR family oxidoreductase [Mycobacteroides abscessus]MCU8692419.1 SDR family oxidoreductase [Mycobacteroides abscessus]MCU8711628.1 SDR family oxidoreductase [Mycobacteroides abscessus]MCU8716374.1 SDR family oxidoreductase [Mycobacteroides abscessus]MCU8750389.1 SDR family oxidoreductase [Mycobacteroides abscessus]MCU8760903.1 SDR family oxidoreductase [Mycobacteroides abscessus]